MTTEDDLASFFAEDIDNIVADPEKFRKKLGIGLDAFKLLSKADKLDGFLSSAAVGGAGALGVFAAWSSSLGVLGSIGASIGLVATPIGWMALAGGAGLATSYGIKRLLGSAKQGAVTEIPNFINTPIDVLGGSICDVLTPILLKIAYADNDFSVGERETIVNYFTDQWGINPSYIENLISDIGNEFTEFNYVILADSLKELAIESGDIKYDDMVKEIISAAEEVMTSDGIIDEREVQEIEKLKFAFITTKPSIKKKLSNAFKTTKTATISANTSIKEEKKHIKVTAEDVNSGKKIVANISNENYEALRSLAQDKISDSKLKYFIDNIEMSADAKALIASILETTIKVGELVVRVGKRIIEIVILITTKFSNATFGLIIGLLVGALVASIPLLGVILGSFVTPIAAIFGLTKGYIDDLKDQALTRKMNEAVAMFQPLNGEINVAS